MTEKGGDLGDFVYILLRRRRFLIWNTIIVTVLCDYGTRYQSRLYNPEFLRSKGLPAPEWLEHPARIDAPFAAPAQT